MSRRRRHALPLALALLLPVAATGCIDMFLGPDAERGRLDLSFQLADEDGAEAGSSAGSTDAYAPIAPRLSTTITGSQGATLVLHDIRIVVGEFTLKRDVGDCATSDDVSGCERFVADPHLLPWSLGELEAGEEIRVSESAPADVYSALEFAIRPPGGVLLTEIRQQGQRIADDRPDRPKLAFADWPEEATAFVSGAYDEDGPDGAADPVPFRIFFRGEAAARVDFPEDFPLVVRAGETTEASIVMRREVWRASDDEQVLDLSQLDYDETGEVFTLDAGLIEGLDSVQVSG